MNFGKSSISKKIAPKTGKKVAKKVKFTILRLILLAFLVLVIGGGIYGYTTVKKIIADAPDISNVAVSPTEAATYIYNQAGQRVQKLTLPEANRDLVTLDKIPVYLQHAVVAIEDERFYQHNGIDPKGILRAFWIGISSGSFSEGASTITQQLLKNSVFPNWTSEVTFKDRLTRKVQEQYLALQLERTMTKDQILEDYLNAINLGAGCYGVQAAAYTYFGKDVSELTLSESAVIAGITQNPTMYNPIVYPEKNARRRQSVLDHMLDQDYITQAEYDEAMADDVYSRIHANEQNTDSISSIYTFYQDAMIDQVMEDLMNEKGYTYKQAYKAVYTGGLRIFSAQDDAIQQICDEEFENPGNFPSGSEVGIDYALSIENTDGEITHYGSEDLRAYIRRTSDPSFDLMYATSEEAKAGAESFKASVLGSDDTVLGERVTITPQPQASVVIIDQATGYIKAIVGGRGEKEASLTLNRATYTMRQPGSTFKIITAYAPALDACGKTLAATYDNEEYYYEDGTKVSNWDLGNYTGPTTIRDAIVQSINIVAVKCITEISPRLGYEYAKAMGITSLVESYDNGTETLTDIIQPLALGGITKGVTNLELCGAYASIANLGQYIQPKFYTQVLDQYGNVVLDNSAPASSTAMKASTAYLLTDAMKGVVSDPVGTAYGQINLGYMPVAGKTGTTSSYKDIWFAGFTPYYTCCVWGGYDNNEDLPGEGIYHTYNKVLWTSIMSRIHANLPVTSFQVPGNIVTVDICKDSGLVAIPGVCSSYSEKFEAGTQPGQYCNIHGSGAQVNTTQSETSSNSDISPDAITIYSTDQATIYDDMLDDMGVGNDQAAPGGTAADGDAANGNGDGAADHTGAASGSGNADTPGGADGSTGITGGGNGITDGASGNGTTGGSGDITIFDDSSSGQTGNGSQGSNENTSGLTQEQIAILNQIPDALP
ncbi:MAG: transglycosylase domain-containing protein [Lachnospiraceae bacterium]|nr:transglycosylase domain-containing protein [Lachnospiraceae bacterium]